MSLSKECAKQMGKEKSETEEGGTHIECPPKRKIAVKSAEASTGAIKKVSLIPKRKIVKSAEVSTGAIRKTDPGTSKLAMQSVEAVAVAVDKLVAKGGKIAPDRECRRLSIASRAYLNVDPKVVKQKKAGKMLKPIEEAKRVCIPKRLYAGMNAQEVELAKLKECHPRRIHAVKNAKAAATVQKLLSENRPKRKIAMKSAEATAAAVRKDELQPKAVAEDEKTMEELLDNVVKKQPSFVRRSLSLPSNLNLPIAGRGCRRCSSVLQTYPNADFPYVSQLQMDERRSFRREVYELQLIWKSQKEERKRLQRLGLDVKRLPIRARAATPHISADSSPEESSAALCFLMNCLKF